MSTAAETNVLCEVRVRGGEVGETSAFFVVGVLVN
jgi:hypothetical protein